MGRVFKSKAEATEYTPLVGDKFESIVADKCEEADPKITWEEVALFNWGTSKPKEVARALVELLGVRKWDDPDPNKWELDPAREVALLDPGVGRVAVRVHDHVVELAILGEVLGRVVDDMIGAEVANDVGVGAAADRCHVGTAMLGELDGDGADGPRGAVDED